MRISKTISSETESNLILIVLPTEVVCGSDLKIAFNTYGKLSLRVSKLKKETLIVEFTRANLNKIKKIPT